MHTARKQQLEDLRARIAALEQRLPEAATAGISPEQEFGPLDLFARPGGLLHEVFTDDLRGSGPALGFCLGLARPLLSPTRPALLYLQLSAQGQELGFPYALGLDRFGIAPTALLLCQVESVGEFLWALEEAIGCPAVAAVIADIAGHPEALDFTASRRLALRVAASRTTALLLRYGAGREASASTLRWRVLPAASEEPDFDPAAPGPPRFAVTLEKSRLGLRTRRLEGKSFALEWTDHGFVVVADAGGRRAGHPAAAPRPHPALLGDRLSATG